FFFQAEDGIRDRTVTGVQTCALPIYVHPFSDLFDGRLAAELLEERRRALADAVQRARPVQRHAHDARLLGERLEDGLPDPPDGRSEERRVGKECRGRGGRWDGKGSV